MSASVIIIGGGPTGLSATYHLGKDAILLEQNATIGGWCRSIEDGGFTFDYAGHIMFSKDEYVHAMYRTLLGENVHWQDREAWVYSKNVYSRYPFQGALYGLPADVIKECIIGAVEARYGKTEERSGAMIAPAKPESGVSGQGSGVGKIAINGNGNGSGNSNGLYGVASVVAKSNGNGNGHATKSNGDGHAVSGTGIHGADDKEVVDCCADGTSEIANGATVTASEMPDIKAGEPRNFEEFIYKVWGAGIAKHFAIPYNRKLWAVPLAEMETSWLGGRVPLPNLEEMIEGALSPVAKPMGPNARFGYPLRGGFQALMDGFWPHIGDQIRLNTRITGVSAFKHTVTLDDGTVLPYEQLISTMPLPALVRMLGEEAPVELQAAVQGLRHVSVRCVNIGVGRENLTEKHWIYYPEETVFHRIFVQGNASPHCNPVGGFGLTCEITYSEYKPLPCDGEALIQRCIEDCHKVGIFTPEDEVWVTNQVDMPYAYVVYDHGRAANVNVIRDWLLEHDIVLSGRYSEWEYYNSDHAFVAGKQAADAVQLLRQGRERTIAIGA